MPAPYVVLLTPSLPSRLHLPCRDRRFRSGRNCSPKSLPFNLFADPHPLNLYPTIFYKNSGEGPLPIRYSPFFISHSRYILLSSVCHNSFVCHSYENTRGVGVFFPFRNPLVGCRGYDPDDERLSKLSTNSCPPRFTDRLPLTCPNPVGVTTTPASTPLDATLMDLPASVASKRLTVLVKSFRCNIYKNRGWHIGHHDTRTTAHQSRVTSHCQLRHRQCYHSEET